jgi:hypothetical protein
VNKECPYCHRPAAPDGSIFHEVECDGLREVRMSRLQYDAMKSEHCQDCCCARSWAALGITQYTGKSIAEHIQALRSALSWIATGEGRQGWRGHKAHADEALASLQSQSPMGESRSTDYEQAGVEAPKGNASESPSPSQTSGEQK